jgi:hypothetical protein
MVDNFGYLNATQSNMPFVSDQPRELPTSPIPAVIPLTKCSNMFGLGFILHGHQPQVQYVWSWFHFARSPTSSPHEDGLASWLIENVKW